MASTSSRSVQEGKGDDDSAAAHSTTGSSETDEECMCLAMLDDRDAVIAIDRNIYYGLDFLPGMYPSLVQGEGVYGHIYKIRDRVVSFTTVEFVDGGQTLVTSGGRVAPDCRGTGVFGRFIKQLLQKYLSLPGVRYFALTTDNVNLEANGAKIMKTHKQILEKVLTHVEGDASAMDDSIAERTVPGVRPLTEDDIRELISADRDQLRHLFPEDRIVLNWEPFRVMAANLHSVLFYGSAPRLFLASVASDVTGSADAGDITATPLMSCGSYYPCQLGYCYMVDLFGDGSSDQLLSHAVWHARQLRRVAGHSKVVVWFYFTRNLDDVMAMLERDYPLRRVQWPYDKLVLFEQEV